MNKNNKQRHHQTRTTTHKNNNNMPSHVREISTNRQPNT